MPPSSSPPSPARFQWQTEWKSVTFLLLMLPLLIGLGFWQLERAEEKRRILAAFQARQALPVAELSDLQAPEWENYRRVKVEGRFDAKRYWLIDNQIRDGRFGYELVALFHTLEGPSLLVNRGWLPGDVSRRELPAPAVPVGEVSIEGEIYRTSVNPLHRVIVVSEDFWPRRVQGITAQQADAVIDESVLPFTLRLVEHSVAALSVKRMIINVQPAKHTAYAVQWFVMALALVLLFVWRNSNVGSLIQHRKGHSA